MNTVIIIVSATLIGVYLFRRFVGNHKISQVDISRIDTLINDHDFTIIDVRTPQEFKKGHLPGARNIPVSEISNRIQEIVAMKNQPLLVYCHAGNRSAVASGLLAKNGFDKVTNLQGGIVAWTNSGRAIEY